MARRSGVATWSARATAWMDHWLTHEVGPNGEWIPEGSHYTIVSYEPFLAYAVAASLAGRGRAVAQSVAAVAVAAFALPASSFRR